MLGKLAVQPMMLQAELFDNDPGIFGWTRWWQIEGHWPPNNQAVQNSNKLVRNNVGPVYLRFVFFTLQLCGQIIHYLILAIYNMTTIGQGI